MVSSFNAVPLAPTDPLFGLMAAFKADAFDKKVDLGVGAYRDDNAKPWILPVVKKVGLLDPVIQTKIYFLSFLIDSGLDRLKISCRMTHT